MASDSGRPTVLITGASAGIGSELVPFFAGTGHNVVLVGAQKPVLEGIAAAVRHVFRVDAVAIACDLAEPDAAHAIFAELSQREIDVDVLVNNASFGMYEEAPVSELQTEERIIQANVTALTVLTRLLLPNMTARGSGKILNVASTATSMPSPMRSVYDATKAYVLGFSDALAEELKDSGISVTSLCPGMAEEVFTESGENARPCQRRAISARSVARTGFRALLRGDRVAAPGWRNLAMTSLFA